ncbi:MAG: YjgN family protein [Burkholderiaceae bacterium]|jgi:uncharacterized membrane protein YjgN (DUF898 family)|nr:YjgN family protein [Burkholderiaceae bacterium]
MSRTYDPFADLEPGTLRDELNPALAQREAAERAQREAEEQQRRLAEHAQRLQFTGDGAEYFRIWIVNLLLTVVTIGLYSPWAKVRKTRYFWQNTVLDGHRFDYHGDPWAILRGRLLAVVLLAAYTWGFDISLALGLATIGLLCAVAPWLFLRAQEFKLRNSSYRGLRFGFDADLRQAYARLLPLPIIWFSVTVATTALGAPDNLVLLLSGLTLLAFPWMHHRLKQFQHARAHYGGLHASFEPVCNTFYSAYVIGAIMLVLVSIGLVLTTMMVASFIDRGLARDVSYAIGLAAGALAYATVWPFMAVRLQRAVWTHTTLGPVRFFTYIESGELLRLVLACMALTLVTCGLYWPYAAVRLARYRVQCLEVRSTLPLQQLAGSLQPTRQRAAGDGAADLFGLDVGL